MTLTAPAWIVVAEEAGTLILRLCGELDTSTRDLVEPAVLAAIPTAHTVVLDLGDLTFCDSTGLSMFLTAHQKAEAEGHTLIIGNIPANIARLLEISGVDRLLNIPDE